MKAKYFVFKMLNENNEFKGFAICKPYAVKEMLVKRISTYEIIDLKKPNYVFAKQETKELLKVDLDLGPKGARMIELAFEDLYNKNNENLKTKTSKKSKRVPAFKEESYEILGK